MITGLNGIAVRCSLCVKSGPIIRYDATRYRHMVGFPNHPNEFYIRTINEEAEKEALAEGFVALIDPTLPADEVDGEELFVDPNVQVQNAQNAYRMSKHVCPSCLQQLSECIVKKKITKKK